ncbi:MAG: transcription termination/antitermination protein NusG [Actinomycetota bacterium]
MTESDFPAQPTTTEADSPDGSRGLAEARAAAEAMGDRVADTETDEAAELVERAEQGDDVAELALQEAGGGEAPEAEEAIAQAEPVTDETQLEAVLDVERQAVAEPPSPSEDEGTAIVESAPVGAFDVPPGDVTDVPTDEATLDESEAERSLASDAIEGEDEGPLVATGPETYVEPEPPEVIDLPIETAEARPEETPAEAPEAPAAEPAPETPPETAAAPVAEAAAEAVPEPAEETRKQAAAEAVEAPAARSIFGPPGDWYVIHTYAGYENKVKANLNSRIGSMQMEDKIFDVVIPMEDVMEIKGGKKQVVQKKVFPGYLLVKMVYDNDSWYVVRNTPGVTGFVSSGTGTKPTPLSRREVEKILAVKEETKVKPQFRLEWEEGDVVRIMAGPFADFTGTIAEINVEQSKLKVMVNIFDRETPVELAFDQVAKA